MIPGLQNQIRRDFGNLLREGSGTSTDVTLRWSEPVGGLPADYDPQDESSYPALETERSEELRAFVHFVSPTTSGYQRFAELQTGDAIVDLPPATALDGKRNVRFEIQGQVYVQKLAGREVTQSWDVLVDGSPAFRTLLLTLAE